MRVKVENTRSPGGYDFGWFVGLLVDDRGESEAVIRLDGYGMMLKAVHPSRVSPVTPSEEEEYKP